MKASPYPLLTLSSGRSGTTFLADFFARNARAAYSTHEPYWTPGNPTLFGPAIAWNTQHADDRLLPLLERKCRFVRSRQTGWYVEANHAFVKAFDRYLPELLPEAGFIHLVRNPLHVAKSAWLREQRIRRIHMPLADYTTDTGERLYRWSLTGQEPLYIAFAQRSGNRPLTRYGFYVLQWFEVEYRIQQLLQRCNKRTRVFCIDVDRQLQDARVLGAMLEYFGLPATGSLDLELDRNKTVWAAPSVPSAAEEAEFRFILQHLPDSHRRILTLPLYANGSFASVLEVGPSAGTEPRASGAPAAAE